MYFWNIQKLKKTLRASLVTEKQGLVYLVINTSLINLYISLIPWAPYPYKASNFWDFILSILGVITPIFGIIWAYQANRGNVGNDFLLRFTSLSCVLGFRFIAGSGIALIPLILFLYLLNIELPEENHWVDTITYTFIYILYYWRLATHMKDVAHEPKMSIPTIPTTDIAS